MYLIDKALQIASMAHEGNIVKIPKSHILPTPWQWG